MTTPSTADFFDAAAAAYDGDPAAASGLTLLQGARGAVTATRKDGFHGVAFETVTGQVIVAFEGTDLGSLNTRPTFVNAQIQADRQIYDGANPTLYDDAFRFTHRALAVAAAQGISPNNVFLAGHSLGGAEAEYVAANTGLSGDTFGAPGIPSADIAPGEASGLTNLVDFGDPVGNYSANPNLLRNFLASDQIERFGAPTYLGNPSDARALSTAGRIFGQTDVGTAVSLGILGHAVANHHLLDDYATDLGLPASGTGGGLSGVSPQVLAQVIGDITGAGPNAPAAASADAPTGTLAKAQTDLSATFGPAHHHGIGTG
ncbi:MAG TPA: hypothetical protein VH414_00040 [Lichenihabitans sp.]|jgi:hypothetical protein|nr:hypothetical protein [Lichenihabitans sp.]